MKTLILTLLLIFTISYSQAQQKPEDFGIISQLLFELEERNWFPEDIYPILPPPPESKEYLVKLRKDLTPEQADSLFKRIKVNHEQHLKNISERKVDSSTIFMATENYLSGSKCKGCGIKPDSLLNNPSYSRHKQLVKLLIKGKKRDLRIPFEAMNYTGKYQLKSIDDFPSREEMYERTLNFLNGGEISFSRFHQKDSLGMIYFSTSFCKNDCAAGYLVLYERKNGKWKIFDILLQWTT